MLTPKLYAVVIFDFTEPHMPPTVIGPFSSIPAAQAYLKKELEEMNGYDHGSWNGEVTVMETPMIEASRVEPAITDHTFISEAFADVFSKYRIGCKIRGMLDHHDIRRVGDLRRLSECLVLRTPNFGKHSMKIFLKKLKELNITLRAV